MTAPERVVSPMLVVDGAEAEHRRFAAHRGALSTLRSSPLAENLSLSAAGESFSFAFRHGGAKLGDIKTGPRTRSVADRQPAILSQNETDCRFERNPAASAGFGTLIFPCRPTHGPSIKMHWPLLRLHGGAYAVRETERRSSSDQLCPPWMSSPRSQTTARVSSNSSRSFKGNSARVHALSRQFHQSSLPCLSS